MFSDGLRFWGAWLGGGHPGFLFGVQSWHRLQCSVPSSRAAEPRHPLAQVLCVRILPFGKNSPPPRLGASHGLVCRMPGLAPGSGRAQTASEPDLFYFLYDSVYFVTLSKPKHIRRWVVASLGPAPQQPLHRSVPRSRRA